VWSSLSLSSLSSSPSSLSSPTVSARDERETVNTLQSLRSVPGSVQRPLIIIPGHGGSMLDATFSDGTRQRIWKKIQGIVFEDHIKRYLWCKEGTTELTTAWGKPITVSRCESVLTPSTSSPRWTGIEPPMDEYGLMAISILNAESVNEEWQRPTFQFNELIGFLEESLGYVAGETLFGFPYDWRQSTVYSGYLLKQYVDRIMKQTQSSGVDLVSHSLGGLVVQSYLGYFAEQAEHTENWIAIAAPFGGIGAALNVAGLTGWTMGTHSTVDPWTIHQMVIAAPSSYDVIARSLVAEQQGAWKEEEPILQVLHSNNSFGYYDTAQSLEIVISANSANTIRYYPGGGTSPGPEQPLPVSKSMLDSSRALLASLSMDRVQSMVKNFWNIYGTLYPTLQSVILSNPHQLGDSPPYSSLLHTGAAPVNTVIGDELVAYDSAVFHRLSPKWQTGFKATHGGLLHSSEVNAALVQFLGRTCSWEGKWALVIEDNFQEIITIHQTGWFVSESTYQIKDAMMWNNVVAGSLVGTFGDAQFEWIMSDDCQSWTGTWHYPWSDRYHWTGRRVVSMCNATTTRSCSVDGGTGISDCIDGYWSSTCRDVVCNEEDGLVLFDLLPPRQSYCALPIHPAGDYRIYLVVFVIVLLVAVGALALCIIVLYIRKRARRHYQTVGSAAAVNMRELYDEELSTAQPENYPSSEESEKAEPVVVAEEKIV